jgi:acylphosphatase
MADPARVHLFVSGVVQGVFFRAHARDMARDLGLTGWVKNLADGRVEIIAEGDSEKLQRFIEWCRRGPAGSSVEDLEIRREEATGEFDGFAINYQY